MLTRLLGAVIALGVLCGSSNAAPVVANAGFESPSVGGGFQYGPFVDGFTFNSGSGVAANGSAFNVSGATGNQAGFLQGAGSTISQTIGGFTPGFYSVSFLAEGRNGQNGANPFQVSIDGTPLTFAGNSTLTPTVGTFTNFTSDQFLVLSPNATLSFNGQGVTGADVTSFVDTVGFNLITPVPEPTTIAAFGLMAVGGAGYVRRRVKGVATA